MATTYLKRLPVSNGSNTTGTLSAWLKRGDGLNAAAQSCAIGGQEGTDGNNRIFFGFWGDSTLALQIVNGGTAYEQSSAAVFKDPDAWYHIVARLDTSNGVAQDRIQLFVNGDKITTYTTNDTFPSSVDIKLFENTTSCETLVGARKSSSSYNNISGGSMSHVHVIDGTAYDASTFGETDATSGIWKIKTSPTVTYGTNGFFLKFEDRTNLDLDSGTNTFTDFVTAGTLTANYDSPSNNFSTWSPLYMPATGVDPVFSNGNTTVISQDGSGDYWGASSTLGMVAGKWYAEFKAVTASNKPSFGICLAPVQHQYNENYLGEQLYDYAYISDGGTYNDNSETAAWGDTFTTGDIVMVAVDLDNLKIYFGKNGTWQDSGDPTSGATGTGAAYTITSIAASTVGIPVSDMVECGGSYHFACSDQSTGPDTMAANFGNGYFQTTAVTSANADDAGIGAMEYDVPAGYYCLCTKNIKAYGG